MAAFRRAIELEPELALAHGNLASTLHAAGRIGEAIAAYDRAIALDPQDFKVQSNRGVALQETDRTDMAIAAYRRALELNPDYVVAQRNLGVALHRAGRAQEAIAACRRAIALGGDDAVAYSNLGMALQETGQRDQAIAALERAIALDPGYVESYNHLGNVLRKEGRLDEAIAAYRRAIALVPDYAYAHNNLGGVYKEQGRLDLALACLRQAVALKPDFAEAASNLLFDLHFHPDHDAQAILAEHRAWARQYAEPLAAQIRPHANDRAPDRRLRVGFVSPDFRGHPVGQLLLPLFTHHDRGHAEFVAYSDVREPDATHRQAQGPGRRLARHHRPERSATWPSRIRADRIDILVDLSLHTANNRMLVFARKPAPVQVTMLGLPSTTGLATMDYRLTDPYLDPPGASDDALHRAIDPAAPLLLVLSAGRRDRRRSATLPAAKNGCHLRLPESVRQGQPAGAATLGEDPAVRARLATAAARAAGQSPRRRSAALSSRAASPAIASSSSPRSRLADYLTLYHDLICALDPFPYSGGTTTMDALWMGVPVITLAGRTAVGRGGVSILSNLGLPELIARTPEQYVAIAVALAGDPARLAALAPACGSGCRHRRSWTANSTLPMWKRRFGGCGRPGVTLIHITPIHSPLTKGGQGGVNSRLKSSGSRRSMTPLYPPFVRGDKFTLSFSTIGCGEFNGIRCRR